MDLKRINKWLGVALLGSAAINGLMGAVGFAVAGIAVYLMVGAINKLGE